MDGGCLSAQFLSNTEPPSDYSILDSVTTMSGLKLERVNQLTQKDIAGLDFSFTIRAEVAKPISQLENDLPFQTRPIPERVKDFGFDEEQVQGSDGLNKAIFVLRAEDGRVYGYAVASKNWNRMVVLDFIGLDASVRGGGNALRLLDAVKAWTREIGLGAVRIEGQSNNVAACRFYKKAGMVFGGYDEHLYSAMSESRGEIAVFFYALLD
ncbi:streptothricin-acetyltransferase [Cordyceps militaris CM01]|uniref:Streptothricin-acetyltransferase n=1 Tax=Cordyceps militaris (strain CM01) TaxID=983644 RepID=G3J7N2_CORMM|nr:streptothricin-acetyltransferase [Cordyceps militaris CM01]EGX95498.1 streptothricin-acetyltransferase [Cordyceps militaris CM01]